MDKNGSVKKKLSANDLINQINNSHPSHSAYSFVTFEGNYTLNYTLKSEASGGHLIIVVNKISFAK